MHHAHVGDAGPLQVCFASRNRRPGAFEHYHGGHARRLLLNCPNSWYVDGVPGFSGDVDETVTKVAGLDLAIGSSMGGFGAVLIGSLAGARRVVAFGVELVAGLPGGYSHEGVAPGSRYSRLDRLIDPDVRYDIVVGEYSPVDLHGAAQVRHLPNVTVHVVASAGHAVVVDLKAAGQLEAIVAAAQGEGALPLVNEGGRAYDVPVSELPSAALAHAMAVDAPKEFAIYLKRARAWPQLQDLYDRHPGFTDIERVEGQATAALRLKRYESARQLASALIEMCEQAPIGSSLLAEALAGLGDLPAALDKARRAKALAVTAGMNAAVVDHYDRRLAKLVALAA